MDLDSFMSLIGRIKAGSFGRLRLNLTSMQSSVQEIIESVTAGTDQPRVADDDGAAPGSPDGSPTESDFRRSQGRRSPSPGEPVSPTSFPALVGHSAVRNAGPKPLSLWPTGRGAAGGRRSSGPGRAARAYAGRPIAASESSLSPSPPRFRELMAARPSLLPGTDEPPHHVVFEWSPTARSPVAASPGPSPTRLGPARPVAADAGGQRRRG